MICSMGGVVEWLIECCKSHTTQQSACIDWLIVMLTLAWAAWHYRRHGDHRLHGHQSLPSILVRLSITDFILLEAHFQQIIWTGVN